MVLFGPGYGEAIAVHLGESAWLLADSCIDPFSQSPAALTYLQAIGVPLNSVRAVVATHWHDDHVRGLAKVVAACPQAELQMSSIFNSDEARVLLAAYSNRVAPAVARGTAELFAAVSTATSGVFHLHHRSTVIDHLWTSGRLVRVVALAPSQAAITRSVSQLAQFIPDPSASATVRHITPLRPNAESVVLHVDFGGHAVLLGSDLEDHQAFGWTAVAADPWTLQREQASVYKVAHHGSHTGECNAIWTDLLTNDPITALTPFVRGKQALPTAADLDRLKNKSAVYLSSTASRKPKLGLASMKGLSRKVKGLTPVNNGFGAIRLRRDLNASAWSVECFGDAHAV